jgi:hypothetical protein
MPPDVLLQRIAAWCTLPLHDWRVVVFQSASLSAALWQRFWEGIFILPRRWRPQVVVALRYDTPARAACAGYWHLHARNPHDATEAFAAVRQLPHGEELYANAMAMAVAHTCQSLADITTWQPPGLSAGTLLRPQVEAVFRQLAAVAHNVALVQQSQSVRQRNSALNRASGMLSSLPAQMHDCPTPERALLEEIAEQWLKIVLASASAVGTLDVREPVNSPYIVGAPVPAERLTGRQDLFDQIAASWAKPGQRDSLVIFGHRRMGKSSIVRNLGHFCAFLDDTGVAVLNLQSTDWTQGMSDLCYAIAFELWRAAHIAHDEPHPDTYQLHPLTALRQFLAHLPSGEQRRRYILILDEYELLDEKLSTANAEAFITALRGFTQQYPWLAIALVGLHTLEERSASFYQAIYAWRPIRVGLMDTDAVADVLQVQDDSFPLEYSLEAVQRVYDLTGGQPFLVQLLGDSLVQRFNRQLRQQLEPPSPTFSVEDVEAVVAAPQFYEHGHVYFHGIWEQAGEAPSGQQRILRALAHQSDGLEWTTLQQASGLHPEAFNAALDALSRHDVVTCWEGICRYSVELLRRWVVAGHTA